MQRISKIDTANTPADVQATLDGIKAKLGTVPNIFLTMASAPALLNGYLSFSGALGAGTLPVALREQIALVTAGANGCDYCASAHSALGKMAGLSKPEIVMNLAGKATDAKTQAALNFARSLVVERGVISNDELSEIRNAGFSDQEILEILGNVAVNLVTNYFNHLADTEIDFPRVEAVAKAA